MLSIGSCLWGQRGLTVVLGASPRSREMSGPTGLRIEGLQRVWIVLHLFILRHIGFHT